MATTTTNADELICDCGHPVSFHRYHSENGQPFREGGTECGWCPPHSKRRCACKAPTTTGDRRDETYVVGRSHA